MVGLCTDLVPINKDNNEKSDDYYTKILDKVEDHVNVQLNTENGLGLTLKDVILAAVNQEVLLDPHRMRLLTVDKKIVIPTSISHPASQCVDLLIAYDSENHVKRVISRMFGNAMPRETKQERSEKAKYERHFVSPVMTSVAAQIGQEIVQEYIKGNNSYYLPSFNFDTVHKLKTSQRCRVCLFKTKSLAAFSKHQRILHYVGHRYVCTMCDEFNNNVEQMEQHYKKVHATAPVSAEEFNEPQLYNRSMSPREEDELEINRWLWPKPTSLSNVTNSTSKAAPSKLPTKNKNAVPSPTCRLPVDRTYSQSANKENEAKTANLAFDRGFEAPAEMPCEICDVPVNGIDRYLVHLQKDHKKMPIRIIDMDNNPPLACTYCTNKFWCYDGFERHLIMFHGLVTPELLRKAQNKQDGGRCQICKKLYAFKILGHLVENHNKSLSTIETQFNCNVCHFSHNKFQEFEAHLAQKHP